MGGLGLGLGGIPVQGCRLGGGAGVGESLYRGVVGEIPVQGCSGGNPCTGV